MPQDFDDIARRKALRANNSAQRALLAISTPFESEEELLEALRSEVRILEGSIADNRHYDELLTV